MHTYELRSSLLIDEKLFKRIDGTSSSKVDFACVDDNHRWFITYDGIAPESKDDFDTKKVLAISVLEKDHGWKLAGMYKRVIGKDEQDSEFHYACPYNPNGENTWRIAYGSIKWN